MLNKEDYLKKIDQAYALRQAGDKAGILAMFATDASFRVAGDHLPIPGVPRGDASAGAKISDLIDAFQFHDVKRLESIVEGNKAAIHWQIVLSPKDGGKITAELCDFWTIGDDGRFKSLIQFADAALVVSLVPA